MNINLYKNIILFLYFYVNYVTCYNFILDSNNYKYYINEFNDNDEDIYPSYINNNESWSFLKDNIPLLDIPDKSIEKTYYFRWWTYRKHINYVRLKPAVVASKKDKMKEQTIAPSSSLSSYSLYIITEFLGPVSWAGEYNTINCAAGHHFREGRWLHNGNEILNQYAKFWFVNDQKKSNNPNNLKGGNPRQYSFWPADSIRALSLVTGDFTNSIELLPLLVNHFETMRRNNGDNGNFNHKGMFFNTDNRDGMEASIGSHGQRHFRPTINSYMYGEARAISRIGISIYLSIYLSLITL
jgi:hypothetical protein